MTTHQAWFRAFADAVWEAHFRAALTRRRYRVSYDAANRWWWLRELTETLPSHRGDL